MGKTTKIGFWIVLTFVILAALFMYWLHSVRYPSTDNAYIQAHIIQTAPEVSGPISQLYVENYQFVKLGQPLLDIDPVPFQVAVAGAKAKLNSTEQNISALEDAVKTAEALVAQRESELTLADKNYQRTMTLVKKGQISLSDGDRVSSTLQVAQAAVVAAKNQLLQAKAQLGEQGRNNAQLRAAEAELDKAQLDLKHTHLMASANGYVMNLTARVGTMLISGNPVFSLIDSSRWWADANFKETDMKRIRPGQTATVVVDIYPDHDFHGVVESISRGSGSAFSIFPAENATGNWVKITQRFTVRINITDPDDAFPLRVGASATVTVDTTK